MAQAEAERLAAVPAAGVTGEAGARPSAGATAGGGVATPLPLSPVEPARPRRFHGNVVLRSERLNLEFGKVVQEVVQRLTDAGATNVDVTVEISATSREGFDEPAVRTVTENARTLRFRDLGFEDD